METKVYRRSQGQVLETMYLLIKKIEKLKLLKFRVLWT